METKELKMIVEGALMAAGGPLSINQLGNLFDENAKPSNENFRDAIQALSDDCESRAYELKEVGNGFRFQVRSQYGQWVSKLWEEKPARYSRALLETLALVAYRQPITRGEVEEVRGVAVSTNIIRTLLEREWVRVVGHRDVPGKPAMYATTKTFLDYFNLKSLTDLPSLADIKDITSLNDDLKQAPEKAVAAAAEVTEETTVEESTAEESTAEESTAEESAAEEVAAEESTAEESTAEESTVEESTAGSGSENSAEQVDEPRFDDEIGLDEQSFDLDSSKREEGSSWSDQTVGIEEPAVSEEFEEDTLMAGADSKSPYLG